MTDRKISELASITGANVDDANDVLTIVDTSETTTKKITREELFKGVGVLELGDGSAASPSLTNTGDANTGVFFPAADTVAVAVGGAEKLRVNSTGLGIGASPISGYDLTVSNSAGSKLLLTSSAGGTELYFDNSGANLQWIKSDRTAGDLRFGIANTEAVRIDSSGNVVLNSTDQDIEFNASSTSHVSRLKWNYSGGLQSWIERDHSNGAFVFGNQGSERMRIDSSGNLGVGTSSPAYPLHVNGRISYSGAIGEGADTTLSSVSTTIIHAASATWQNQAFYTDGSERMRIDSSGNLLVNTTATPANIATTNNNNGVGVDGLNNFFAISRANNPGFELNRTGSDGTLMGIRHDGTQEGSISVSGTTVSYNGAHLSRWFQVPGVDYASIEDRPEILRGSVLTNLDEMCDWEGEDNEQLNKMEVSSVKGDKNVAGVFQDWDDDDDTYLNDGYCAMTGDFVIRIAADCTVERGDLLMSAGDGTACPQEGELADVVRSCTVAKVISTNVSHTYDDGSYLVPCVLMAC